MEFLMQVGMQSAMQPVIQGLMQAGMDALVQCLIHKLQALVLALEVLLHAVIVCPLLLFFQPLSLVCSALHLFHHFFHNCLVSSAHWLVCSALHFFHHFTLPPPLLPSLVCSPFPYHFFHWWLLKIHPTVTI
jgi:hypothetical protein